MTELYSPLQSLREGHWFKLICGASFQHLPAIRNLVLAYALAGADCIDVAADPAVISAARDALQVAAGIADHACGRGYRWRGRPWLMVSFNDGEDPHFRKAEFRAEDCPSDCLRPCEAICPVEAINFSGVLSDRCYGCGRCLPVCPIQQITTRSYVSTPGEIAPLVMEYEVDAIELHTQVGRLEDFQRLWNAIQPWVSRLKLVAISCPDGDGLIAYLNALYDIISPLPCPLIWQTDGRPMSGDIGVGATRAAVKLAQKVLTAGLPGYIQLAGGTNHHTVPKLRSLDLLSFHATPAKPHIAGVAYGSYARTLLAPLLSQLDALEMATFATQTGPLAIQTHPFPTQPDPPIGGVSLTPPLTQNMGQSHTIQLENFPPLLWQAVDLADSLVSQLKLPCSLPSNGGQTIEQAPTEAPPSPLRISR